VRGDEFKAVPLSDFVALYRAYVNTLECSRDRITSLRGECDSVERMEAGDPALVRARKVMTEARAAPRQGNAP
jgi:hypothetical protein